MWRRRSSSGTDRSGPAEPEALFTPAFIALSLAELAYFTAFGLMIPVVPLFAAGPLGAGPAGVGVVVGAFSVTALLLRPFAGRLADRRGRRPLLVAGGALFTVVVAAHLFATGLVVLLVLRALLGVGEAMFFVAAGAALADLAPPQRLGEALSYSSLSLYLGIAAGPALGELLLTVGGYRLAWLGGTALALIATLLALRIPETGTPQPDAAPPLIHRAVLAPGFAFLAGLIGAGGFLAFAALHARDIGMSGAGLVLGMYGVIVIGCRVAFAKLPDRVPPFRLAASALVSSGAGLTVIGLVRTPGGLLAGTALLAVGTAFMTPAFFRAMLSRVAPTERGSATGTFSIFIDLGLGGGPVLLGLLAAATSIPAAFGAAAAVAVLGAVAAAALAGSERRSAGAT